MDASQFKMFLEHQTNVMRKMLQEVHASSGASQPQQRRQHQVQQPCAASVQAPQPSPLALVEDMEENFEFFENSWNDYSEAIGMDRWPREEDAQKVSFLLTVVGEPARKTYFNFELTTDEKANPQAALLAIKDKVVTKRNVIVDRLDFFSATQASHEAIDDFVTRLKVMANSTKLGTLETDLITYKMVTSNKWQHLRTKIVLLISRQFSAGLLLKQYSCDNYVLSWCQLHNVTIQSDRDLQMVEFPKVQQIGFLNGSIPYFSHFLNLGLFKAGVLRIFARGTKISRLTLPNTIEQLYFRDNDITSVDIEPRTKYSIKYLRIHVNKLRDVSSFKSLVNLIELNLCDNLIEHVSFDIFAGMTYLKQLLLCGNRIKTITATLNINLPNLYHLDLAGNFLFNGTFLTHWYFPRLGNFSLRDNLITRLDVRIISQRYNLLRILDVEHNSLDCDTYQQLLKLVHQRKIIYNVDKRVCNIPPSILPRSIPPSGDNEVDTAGDLHQQIRQLKERIYQQVKIIYSQRIEIQQLSANLSTLMEQFDLVADTAQTNDPF
ncbi:uncharacterized protein LOC135702554 [Ochlerotatus camptorhynchus]|uniref:uncharacterized protein LOC135702554 n=1 Tax=Ochlerotatus camptorhynchus TaxID=644619 RepID=UPI0031D3CB4B